MLRKIKKIKENKALKIIGNILYSILFLIVVLMLIIVIIQRTSNNSISIGGYRIFAVATGSMVPKYEVGDVLISKEIEPSEIKVGDTVVYKGEVGGFKDKFVTHQIQSINKQEDGTYKFTTKGISNIEADPEISETQVYGKIIYKVKTLSLISKLISNVYVFYFFVFVPIAIIIYKQIRNLIREDKEEDEDNKSAHVSSWDVQFVAKDGGVSSDMIIKVEKVYPGMEDFEKIIEVQNRGEVNVELSYEIESVRIMDETIEKNDETGVTSESIEEKLKKDYPFKINIVKDDSNLITGSGNGSFKITVVWPYESGDDEADTNWGRKAYEYYENNPDKECIELKLVLKATQAKN